MLEKLEELQRELDVLAKPSSDIAVSREEFQALTWIVKQLTQEVLRQSKELEWKATRPNRKG